MNKCNLLMVDDSPHMHKMVRAFLESDPFELHSAYDGESGLKQAAELRPSLILLDVDMPSMDGFETCRQLKANARGAHIPVIFLTADYSMNDKVKALDMGAVDYITKPFKPDELRARLRAALRVRQRIEQTEMVDQSSGLWNKSFLDLQLPVLLSLSRRQGQSLACFVLKVDGFEKLRAKFGADGEDEIVKGISGILLSETRAEDLLCHCAEGRFVCVMPGTGRDGATLLAERVRAEVEKHSFNMPSGPSDVTCTIGVADTLLGGHLSLLEAANAAVERRGNGINAVVIARDNADGPLTAA